VWLEGALPAAMGGSYSNLYDVEVQATSPSGATGHSTFRQPANTMMRTPLTLTMVGMWRFTARVIALPFHDPNSPHGRLPGEWPFPLHHYFEVSTFPPLSPTNLAPTTVQNRSEPISLSWQHRPRPGVSDPQIDSEVEYWQGDGPRAVVSGGTANRVTLPANTFTTNNAVNFRARTQGGNGAGWSDWSAAASFPLIVTPPPQPPINLAPTTAQNPTRQFAISWQHVPGIGPQDTQDGSEVEYWQGAGPRTVLPGEFGNRVNLLAGTFTTLTPVSFRARTHGLRGGWGEWSPTVTFPLVLDPPLAPTSLLPITEQNRRTPINLSWRPTPNPADWDTQSESQVEIWQDSNNRMQIYAGTGNRLELPSDTFTDNRTVYFRARTQTIRNGWGAWSAVAGFPLSSFQSLAPTNLQPTEVRNPRVDIPLTWQFNRNPQWFPNDGQTNSEVEVWQGAGARITISGGAENRAILPALTFEALVPINFRARTYTNLGGWGEWSEVATFNLAISPSLPPTYLSPTTAQNPRGTIRASWLHTPNLEMPDDVQTDSQARFRQNNSPWVVFSGSELNQLELPAHTFTVYDNVEWQARTHTSINGWGEWSDIATFELRKTPPRPPILAQPVNRAVPATAGAFLQWNYHSPYDNFPSRFDVRYRIEGDADWTEIQIDSQDGRPATSSAMTRSEEMQRSVEWQVRAYGKLGDVGEWSEIAMFSTIGSPQKPIIKNVTNSGRPEITFSVENPQFTRAWEIEIRRNNGEFVYTTGKRAFVGNLSHITERFFNNGHYLARLRIANEHGISSEWANLAFSIAVVPPEAVELSAANNLGFHNKLWFDAIGRMAYVYRAEIDSDKWLRIANVSNADSYEDWTVRPRQRYKYFIRVVSDNFGFADSNIETAMSKFLETTIATANAPYDTMKLLGQLDSKPTKDSDFKQEKTLTHVHGREKPIVQIGMHTDRVHALSFYVSLAGRDRLEELAKSSGTLILRDWRLGVTYGTITGGIRAGSDGFSSNCHVSFNFTETDYPQEVDIE